MELKQYCWKVRKDTLFHVYYAVIDDQLSMANFLCVRYGIKAKVLGSYARPGSSYAIHIIRIRKGDEIDFEEAMFRLPEIIEDAGNDDYESYCTTLQCDLEKTKLQIFNYK